MNKLAHCAAQAALSLWTFIDLNPPCSQVFTDFGLLWILPMMHSGISLIYICHKLKRTQLMTMLCPWKMMMNYCIANEIVSKKNAYVNEG